ncbi:MAG: hypothetical protein HWE23_08840 [Rhodobacteraceae bacterium]|nr:hypothetical protein [Paracoccaceae bacterium]
MDRAPDNARSVRLSVFGIPAGLRSDGVGVEFPTRKSLALILILLRSPGLIAPREKIAAMLWSRADDTKAAQSLRQALRHLKQVEQELGFSFFEADKSFVRLLPGMIETDLAELDALLRTGDTTSFQRACELYAGPLYLGLEGLDPEFGDWVAEERAQFSADAAAMTLKTIDNLSFIRNADQIEAGSRFLLQVDSAFEYGHQMLMKLYLAKGRRAEALQQFRRCEVELRRHLDTEPDEETRRLLDEFVPEQGQEVGSVTHANAAMALAPKGGHQGLSNVELPWLTIVPVDGWPSGGSQAYSFIDVLRHAIGAFRNIQLFEAVPDANGFVRVAERTRYPHLGSYVLRVRCDEMFQSLFLQLEEHPSGRVHFMDVVSLSELKDIDRVQVKAGKLVASIQNHVVARLRHDDGKDTFSKWCFAEGMLMEFSPSADERAFKTLNELESLRPDFSLTYAGWASVELRKQLHYPLASPAQMRPEDILQLTEKSVLMDPWQTFALRMHGWAYMNCGFYDEAKATFREAVSLNPYDPTNLLSAGEALAFLDCSEEAFRHAAAALEIFPMVPRFLNDHMANIKFAAGDFEGALNYLKRGRTASIAALATRVAALSCSGREHDAQEAVETFFRHAVNAISADRRTGLEAAREGASGAPDRDNEQRWHDEFGRWLTRVNKYQNPVVRENFKRGGQLLADGWQGAFSPLQSLR